jgi:outer membrane receptor protein involved in Fe transport
MSVKQSDRVSYSVRATVAVVLGTLATMASAPRVWAADDTGPPPSSSTANAGPPVLEEITVTGTRIKRKDLESTSPLITVDAEALESKAGLNIESYLNQLPNYNPARTPTTENEDVQPSAVNTVGISTISLRGLGANRGLVLIDGHRTTPVNALMVTDINTIPSAMIDHIETITGGASAVYGADAMAGVTNFILKKNFQGAQIDVQDGMTQAGDGNELRATALMGTKFSDGKGSLITGMEYYNRNAAYQRNRSFFTNSWTDPNATGTNNFNLTTTYNAWEPGLDFPSNAALNAVFPNRAAAGGGVCQASGCAVNNLFFNPAGGMWVNYGPLSTSGLGTPPSGNGYGVYNNLDLTMPNNQTSPAPNVVQNLKWNNPLTTISEPQTRYSFWANGTYDITDDVQFYTNARFAESLTSTLLAVPTTAIFGWEASVPFNANTDSPINPAAISPTSSQQTLTAIAQAFQSNPTNNPYINPNFIGPNQKGAQHPVPWQLAELLLSRSVLGTGAPLGPGTFLGGPATCNNSISPANCSTAPTSWILGYNPIYNAGQRTTVERSDVWQVETGFRFPLGFADWTGEAYYSRGQTLDYENAYGNDSLQRYRAVIDSPDYGAGQSFQGNANGASANFGTSVPTKCTSGFYGSIFGAPGTAPSADCITAIAAPLQTFTGMQQDDVQANFNGTLFKLPAGDVSAAVGFEYRRDSGQFTPDNLQSTYSFLDQGIGLYPLGTVNNQISSRDGYAELFLPVLSNLPFMQKLTLDVGGRYSAFGGDIPNATTFKVNMDAAITKSFRIRGGFNRATRAPNLGELFLGEQEYFGGGANFGDPCSVRSTAPFGAGGAANDFSTSGSGGKGSGTPTQLASGQTAAGAMSTYLICQALMGGTAPTAANPAGAGGAGYYYGSTGNQGMNAAAAQFAWLNEQGNPNLKSETAYTWTAGFVFSNLGDNPWISGLQGSVDWWQIKLDHAIELDSPDYANYLCYGTVTVTNAAQAAAQAATPACQNVARNAATGGPTTALLQYDNLAQIATSGIDLEINWYAQLADLGLTHVPGGITFSTEDSLLNYFRTKQSPTSFDVTTNWKGSLGPTLAGTDPGAYSFRLFTSIGYQLPAFSVNLRWRFLPSVNSAQHAAQQAIIDSNKQVLASGKGTLLSWIPNTDLAAPAWSAFDLSGSWNVNKIFQIRAGINNLFDKAPSIIGGPTTQGRNAGYPTSKPLNSYCTPEMTKLGCVNPTAYSMPNDGAGITNAGFYDVFGRTFFLGFKASF